MTAKSLRAGTRGSILALTQTRFVADRLKQKNPGLEIETITIRTTGDKIQDTPLSKIGTKSLFTKEIEEALLGGQIDFAVHSLKDLPTQVPAGLKIGAVLSREDPSDALVSGPGWTLRTLPPGAKIGTSSLRRQAQILALRPDLKIENLRGNLDTRIRKLLEGGFDAIVVALCGLTRLAGQISVEDKGLKIQKIPFSDMLPAVGQGALAVEVRSDGPTTESVVFELDDDASRKAVFCERAFLAALEGGCQIPIGAHARLEKNQIHLEGVVASPSGRGIYRSSLAGPEETGEAVGQSLAEALLNMGAGKILESIRA